MIANYKVTKNNTLGMLNFFLNSTLKIFSGFISTSVLADETFICFLN